MGGSGVGEIKSRAGSLDQNTGDEKAQSEAAPCLPAASRRLAPGEISFSDSGQDIRPKAVILTIVFVQLAQMSTAAFSIRLPRP
jgi:hypothetical protein